MAKMGNLNFDQSVRLSHAIQFLHHLFEAIKVTTHMLKNMLHQNMVEFIILKRPRWCLVIHQNIWTAFLKFVCVHPSFTVIKAAAEVQFSHRKFRRCFEFAMFSGT